MSNELRIKTPEGITFSYQLAGPVPRFLAWTIDMCCLSVAGTILAQLQKILGALNTDLSRGIYILALFATSIGFGILTEWFWRGQTPGKRVMRLRVIDAQGLRLQFSQVVIRNLLRAVDMLPSAYLLGGIAMLLSRHSQRLGDLAASTLVIRIPKILEPDLDQLTSGKFNSLRHPPHLAARLRQRITPAHAQLILQALLRREEFEPSARIALYSELAAQLKALVPYPEETTEYLTDEQYLRNVAEILFSK